MGGGNLILLDAAAYFLDTGSSLPSPFVVLDGRRTFVQKMTASRETHTPHLGVAFPTSSLTLPCMVARDQTAIWDQTMP